MTTSTTPTPSPGGLPAIARMTPMAKATAWQRCPLPGLLCDEHDRVVRANDAATRVLGSDVVGQTVAALKLRPDPGTPQGAGMARPVIRAISNASGADPSSLLRIRSDTAEDASLVPLWLEGDVPTTPSPLFEGSRLPRESSSSTSSSRSSNHSAQEREMRLVSHGIGGEINQLHASIAEFEEQLAVVTNESQRTALMNICQKMKERIEKLSANYRAASFLQMIRMNHRSNNKAHYNVSTTQNKLLATPLSSDLRYRVECSQELHHTEFSLDWERVRGVLERLIDNAFKYGKEINVVTLRISSSKEHYITFSVEDKSGGFPPGLLDSILQENDAVARLSYGSHGLKLTACKKMAETIMFGEFTGSSVEGEGTCISVTVPDGRKLVELGLVPQLRLGEESPGSPPLLAGGGGEGLIISASSATSQVVLEVRRRSINDPVLVVDDQLVQRTLFQRILTRLGFKNIVLAEDGEDAVKKVEEAAVPFSIILMDELMPKLSGSDAARRIFALKGPSYCPIVSISANDSDKAIFMAAGMKDIIAKPWSHASVMTVIGKYVDLALVDPKSDKS